LQLNRSKRIVRYVELAPHTEHTGRPETKPAVVAWIADDEYRVDLSSSALVETRRDQH